ncbi:MAG: polysaccharide pyruvyl transferase family protein [Clostridia bacterium]|nr:polysaccharide pyruvyl transferase family protein [Clostridia bacterium]
MKIGIITHHTINNFGAFLQGWALQEKIKALFPQDEVYIINFIMPKQNIINVGGFFRYYPGSETPRSWLHKITQPALFAAARKRYYHLTKPVYNAAQINALGMDSIVIGSDEVWNYLDKKSYSPVKFGGGLTAPCLVAYAPSAGKSSGTDAPAEVRRAMQNFTALSARDISAQTLCRQVLGVSPITVCDPTFLTPTPRVDNEKIERLTRAPYILFYYCNGMPKAIKERIVAEAHEKGLCVLGGGEYDKLYTQMSVRLTPFEWAELFRRAEYVYTGTFHGVVFSILNRKNFGVYASIESRVKKIAALLDRFGIENRDIAPDGELSKLPNVDYDAVYRHIDKLRADSTDYLYNAVRGEKRKGETTDDTEQSRPETLFGAGQNRTV